MNHEYETLADRAEAGELSIIPGTIRRGAEARAEATRLLMEATGAQRVEDVIPLAVGRPRAGQESGPSPTVRTVGNHSKPPAEFTAQNSSATSWRSGSRARRMMRG